MAFLDSTGVKYLWTKIVDNFITKNDKINLANIPEEAINFAKMYYNTSTKKAYSDSGKTTEMTTFNSYTIYVDMTTSQGYKLYMYDEGDSSLVEVSPSVESLTTSYVVEGYYNTTDQLFYTVNTFQESEKIDGNVGILYVDISGGESSGIYRYNTSTTKFVEMSGSTSTASSLTTTEIDDAITAAEEEISNRS